MQKLVEDKRVQDVPTPALLHPGFHKGNAYVSSENPAVITGVLDWQSASIEPAFIYANKTPDFVTLPSGPEETTFENEHKDSGLPEKEPKNADICHRCRKGLAPKLRPGHGETVPRPSSGVT